MKFVFLAGTAIAISINEQISNFLEPHLTAEQFSKLSSHGCWCNAVLNGANTSPNVLDPMDELCKRWRQARKCTTLTNGACHNIENFGYDSTLACDNQPSECGSDSCKVDAYYLEKILKDITDYVPVKANADQCPTSDSPTSGSTSDSTNTNSEYICAGSAPKLRIVNKSINRSSKQPSNQAQRMLADPENGSSRRNSPKKSQSPKGNGKKLGKNGRGTKRPS